MVSKDEEKGGYEFAQLVTGLKITTLYSKVSRREIPFYRLGRRLVVFSKTELEQWMAARHVEAK